MKTVGISVDILDRLDDLAKQISMLNDRQERHNALHRFRRLTATLRGLTAPDTSNLDTSSHLAIDIPPEGML